VGLCATGRGAKPSPARTIAVPGVPVEAFVGRQIRYAWGRCEEPRVSGAKGFAGGLPNASETSAQPRGGGNSCDYLLGLMVNDLVPTWPEGNNLLDPGFCGA